MNKRMVCVCLASVLYAAASAALVITASPAAAQTWIGPGNDWNTPGHWSPFGVPNSPSAAVSFTGAAMGNVNISSSVQAGTISFSPSSGSYNLTSSPGAFLIRPTAITITSGVTEVQTINLANIGSGSLLYAYNFPLTITNNSSAPGTTLVIGPNTVIGTEANGATPGNGTVFVEGSGTTQISGGLSATGGNRIVGGLTKNGTGTLTLSNASNSYTGGTRIKNGIVSIPTIAHAGVLSPIGADTNAPVNLQLGDDFQDTRGTLLLTGTGTNYETNRGLIVGGEYSFNGGGAIGVQNAATLLTVFGQITGSGSLIKSGPGKLGLVNTTNNFSGGTYIEAGTLVIGASGAVLPPSRDVTVFSGGTLEMAFSPGGNNGNPIGTLNLDGGTFRIVSTGGPNFFLNKLTTGLTGGTVNLSGSTGGLLLRGAGAGISVNGNSTWIGGAAFPSGISAETGITADFFIAPGVTLTNSAFLYNSFRIIGGGTLYLTYQANGNQVFYSVAQGKIRVDDLSVNPSGFSIFGVAAAQPLTLNGGALQYSGPTATSPMPIRLSSVGGAIEVSNAATTLTFTGNVVPDSGGVAGPLVKTGPGTLILNNLANTYGGGITINDGRLDVGADNQLGVANPVVSGFGILRYTAPATTSRTFTLNNGTLEVPSGVTLTMNGARATGGFLRGMGTYSLTGSAALTGVTTFTNTTLNVTGPASISNFAHNGNLTVNSGQTLTMNYGTNGAAGRMTVNGISNVTEFVSYGLLTVPNGGLINNTLSNMVLGGGSTTFVGAVGNLGGKIDLGGQQLHVRGGLLVTNAGSFGSGNGVRNGTTIADYGALVKGTGPYQSVITQNGGQYLPGNSPGTSQVGDFFINGGGGLIFQITDAGPSLSFPSAPGTAGNNPGWGLTQVFTSMNFTATPASPYTITMQTQLPPPAAPDTPGLMSSFDPNRAYQWLIFDLQPGAVFNGTFDPNAINFATAAFVNSTMGGAFSLTRNGGQIFLTFTPVPEPEMVLGAAVAALGVLGLLRRRRRRSAAVTAVLAATGALMLAQPTVAQTWVGPGNDWNTPSHWSPFGVPNSTTAAVSFTGAAMGNVNISSSVSAQSLTFSPSSGSYSLSSSAGVGLSNVTTITVGAGVTGPQTINLANFASGSLLFTGSGPAALTIANNASASAGTTLVIGPNTVIGTPGTGGITVTGTGTTQISAPFAAPATGNHIVGGITKNGTGTLVLANSSNYYTGGTRIEKGTIAIPTIANAGFNSPIGADSSAPGNLQLGSVIPNGPGFTAFRGTLLLTGSNPFFVTDRGATLTGGYSGGGGAIGVQDAASALLWAGQITGGGSLIKTGAGALYLANLTNNYYGGTYVEAGTLIIGVNGTVLPANENVTVFSGATLQLAFNNNGTFGGEPGAFILDGGTFRVSNQNNYYRLQGLVMTGGTVDFSAASNFTLDLIQTGTAVTTNPSSTTATWIGSASSVIQKRTNEPMTFSIASGQTASGIDLDAGIQLMRFFGTSENTIIKAGAGTMRLSNLGNDIDFIVENGALRVDDLTNGGGPLGPGFLILNGGRIAYGGGANATLSKPFVVYPGGGGIDVVNAGTTLTLTSPVTHNGGPFTKGGPGVLVLNNSANNFMSSLTVANGRLEAASDALLGSGNVTVQALGTLRYTANTATARTFHLNNGTLDVPSGVTLAMNGATVGGGFLRGAGTYSLTGGTVLTGVTSFTSTNINVSGPASAFNFSNNAAITVNSGQTFAMNYATNGAAGRITVNGTSNVTDFVSYGLLTVPNGGLINNTGSNMVLGGGSTTFVGAVGNLGGKIDLGGQQMHVRGGLLVTNAGSFASGNGVRNGTTIADYGALVKGTGPYQSVITQNGGQYLPGNSPGTSQVGDFFINPGGNLIFQITDAGPSVTFPSAPGIAGSNPGWGLTQVFTSMNFTATPASPYTITMQTQLPPPAAPDTPGLMSSFDPNRAYQWLIFDLQPGAVFNGTFDPNAINFATAQFINSTMGGSFSLTRNGGQIFLTFTPVPEPELVLGAAFGSLGIVGVLRRRKKKVAIATVVAISGGLMLAQPAAAQTWVGPGNDWNTPSHWSPFGVPNSPTAAVSFTGVALGNVNISSSVQAQSLSFSNPTGSYTLSSSVGAVLSSVTAINVAAGVTNQQTIQLAPNSGGNLLFPGANNLIITNNSTAPGTTLLFGQNTVIGTPGSGGVIVNGAGTTEIAGSFATVASGNHVVGGLTKNGTGTLILSNANNVYFNGTFVNGGTLQLGSGFAIPTGSHVTVGAGAQFNIGSLSNTSATAIGNLTLNGGTFRVPSGAGDYFLNQLTMTGGTVDFTGTINFWLHFTGAGAGITLNPSATPAAWIGAADSLIRNDTAGPLTMNIALGTAPSGIDLDAGIILSNAGTNALFIKSGPGTMRLSNLANTANLQIEQGTLRVDDMAALGSGAIFLYGGILQYGGATSTSSKPLSLVNSTPIQVLSHGANLTLNGGISGPGGPALIVLGPNSAGTSSTLTLPTNNALTGATIVFGNGTLAIPAIANGGVPSPIGNSSSSPNNLLLGSPSGSGVTRGTLRLTGTNPNYATDRGLTVLGAHSNGAGGAIDIQNAATTLTWSGPITGTGSLIKTGPGTLNLTQPGNDFTGGVYVEGGTLAAATGGAIPGFGNATVFAGATLQGFSSNTAVLATRLILNGGTFRSPAGGNATYIMYRLESTEGANVNLTGSLSTILFGGVGTGATINGNTTWTGGAGVSYTLPQPAALDINVAPGATLTNSIPLLRNGPDGSFHIRGGGTVYMATAPYNSDVLYSVAQGRLRVDNLPATASGPSVLGTVASGFLTLDGGALQYGGTTTTSPLPLTLTSAGGSIDVLNPATTLTYTGVLTGFGLLTKSGPGTLILNNTANTYGGGVTVSAGRLDVAADAQLGLANPTVNAAGILRYTASNSTGRTFNLVNGSLEAPSGVTLTLNGAAINGGFLRGSGMYNLAAGASLTGVTSFTSTNINVTGPASASNFSNNAAITVNSGQTFAMNYATNGAAGRITVNGTSNVTDFVSYGLLTVPNGGLINNTLSNMVLGGGSRTFVGSLANPGGKIDLGGQQLLVAGGLLVTNAGSFASGNGVRNGTTVADYGALVKGTGPYQSVITQNGGQYLPGNSPGTSQVGDFFINPGGNLIFQITDAGPSATFPTAPGTAGNNPGWGLTQVFTSMNFTATPASPYTITMQTQLPPPAAPDTPGPMSSFDPNRAYQWLIFDLQPGAVFNGTFDPSAINFATAAFVNPTVGGTFSLARNGGQIFLTFTPVPEPELVLGSAVGAMGVMGLLRRRRKRSVAVTTALAVSGALMLALPVGAQTWVGPSNDWNTPSHWSPFGVPNSPAAAVSFTGAALGNVNISSSVQSQSLSFSNPTGSYTLSSSAGVILSGVTAINVAAGVTNQQTIQLAPNSGGSLLFPSGNNLTITNNSTAPGTTLLIGQNTVIGTPGSGGVIINGSGTTEIAGTFASVASGNHIVGGLTKNGTGTLILSNPSNVYFGGTIINGGTLQLGAGTAIPTGGNVTVASGATFNTGGLSNGDELSSSNAIQTLTLNGGTFRVPSGNGDYWLNQLNMTGGTADFTGSGGGPGFWLHFSGAGAAITVNSGINTWIGSGNSRVQNNTGAPLTINVGPGATLNAGIILSSGGTNPNFVKAGAGILRLSNTGNTANIIVNEGHVRSSDLSTNVGSGAYGTLGSGSLTLGGGLVYDGPTASTAKPVVLDIGGSVQVVNAGSNLTMTGLISESVAGSTLIVFGTGNGGSPSTLSLTGTNTYTGQTHVSFQSILAIPTIANGGVSSPIGASSNGPTNLQLGFNLYGRGELLLTGTNAIYNTDRGARVESLYASGVGGGAIGVQNTAATLNWTGQITGPGSFIKTGAGILTLNNSGNDYAGGTYVEAGRLALGAGTAIPIGGNVSVFSGAEFNIGTVTNASGSAIGTVALNGGTFRVPSGNGDYYLNRLEMTGGTVDFTGTNNFWLHFTGAGAGISTFAGSTTANWIGAPNSLIRNDTAGPLTINVALGTTPASIDLDAGILMSGAGTNANFIKTGGGIMRLTNPANTANFTITNGAIRVDDMSALGSGTITLNGGSLMYGGPTAASSKNIALTSSSGIINVFPNGVNLTLNGTISGPGSLSVIGPFTAGTSSTLTFASNNPYTGLTWVHGRGVLAIPTIANGGDPSPIGNSSNAPSNLLLGFGAPGGITRGTLMLTGANPNYSTDRGVTVAGTYFSGGGGAIGVQNAPTTLNWSGQITGLGSLIKTGAGTLELNNNLNNHAGGTYVEAGTLKLAAPLAIPFGGNVTVFPGAEFNTGGQSTGGGDTIGTVTLNGGTLRVVSTGTSYFLNQLVMNGTIPTIDATGSTGNTGFFLNQAGAAIAVNSNSSWIGPSNFYIGNATTTEMPITIAPGVTLTSSLSLASPSPGPSNPFRITGGGTYHWTGQVNYVAFVRVDHARLMVNSMNLISPGAFDVTLDAGTLAYNGATTTIGASFKLGAGGGIVEVVNPATTLTLTEFINGTNLYPLTKTGPGTLSLTSLSNSYVGGLIVNAGRLDVGNDAHLGLANPTVNAAGILRYTASNTTARTFNLNNGSMDVPSGVNLTMNGAAVNGGFLRGAGNYTLTGNSALTGATTFTSTTMNVTGPTSFANFANNGNLTLASGQTMAMNYATNTSAGRMTINGTAIVSDFVSNGFLAVPAGGLVNNSVSNMVLGGGSTTFVGAVGNLGGKIDLGGQQLHVRGGLLVTNAGSFASGNGVRNGTTIADYGALVKGTGPYQSVITQNGGQYLPGNSPGTSQVGDFFINGGGNLIFQITDAGPSLTFPSAPGTAGNNPGWGLTQVFTSMNFTATPASPYTITMQTQLPPPAAPDTPGPMSSFDPNRAYQWLIFDLQPGAVFNGTFDPSAINFATAAFVNPTVGGTFSLARNGGQIFLTFTPVPEPELVLGSAVGAIGVMGLLRRRRRSSTAVTTVVAVTGALMLAQSANAQTWIGPGPDWNTPSHWSPFGVPNSPAAAVSFTGAALGNVNISSSVQAQSLSFSNPTGSYTLSSSAGVILSGVTAINVAAGVTNQQTIQLAPNSGGSLLFPSGNNLTITNNSTAPGTTLLIGQNTVIGTPGSGGVIINGSGTTEIAGTFASVASGNHIVGGLTKNGTGTLILSNPSNLYFGGTFVNGGTLQLGSGTAIPTGGNVTVGNGATFNTGGLSNGDELSSSNAIQTLTLNGGTFRVPSGNGDYWLNQLNMTGGTVDFTGSGGGPGFYLHFSGAGAGININTNPTTTAWIGSGASRIQNDTAAPLSIFVNAGASGLDLDAGIILSGGGSNNTFIKSGPGTMRLTNVANTANFQISGGTLRVDDMAALGSGTVTIMNGGFLRYGGTTAASNKPLFLQTNNTFIEVITDGTNLTLNGAITETGGTPFLAVLGPIPGASTLTLTNTSNNYSGATIVHRNAVLAIPTIANGGVASPIGRSSNAPTNLQLGFPGYRGTLLLTGTNSAYSTDRGATLLGTHVDGGGGVIGVQNAATNLTWSGQITGSGRLIKNGAGTLTLTNGSNNYTGGTFIEAGRLALGVGTAIPAGGHVTVFNGAEFNIGTVTNASGSAIGTVALNGGTFRVPSGNGDYYLNRLEMTGGAVDFTGTNSFWLHFTGAGAGISTFASSTTANWIGAPNSLIRNDTAAPLTINVALGSQPFAMDLNAGIILSGIGTNANFIKAGDGRMRLSNTGNTANFTVTGGFLQSNDISTNVGAGAFGTLGTGTMTLAGGGSQYSGLAYDGATASSAKPLTLNSGSSIQVVNAGTNLTLTSPIGESAPGSILTVFGPGYSIDRSTLTLTANNSYTGATRIGLSGILAIPTIGNAGTNSPLGASSNAPGNLQIGFGIFARGELLLIGTNPTYSTDRGVTIDNPANSGAGGAIGVQNAATNLIWNGQITGLGGLIKTGAGTLSLANSTNNYSGGTLIEGGQLSLGSGTAIPAGGNVTVFGGGVFDMNAQFNEGFMTGIGTVALNGGTLRVSTPSTRVFQLNSIISNSTGTVIDATGAGTNCGLWFSGAGAAITVNNSSTWSGPASFGVFNANGFYGSSAEMPLTIAPNATLTSAISFGGVFPQSVNSWRVTGGGTLYLTSSPFYTTFMRVSLAQLRLDDLASLAPTGINLTLDNGALLYGGPSAATANTFAITANGGTMEILNAAATVTLNSAITGGPLTKAGPGTLNLTNPGNLFSRLTVSEGVVQTANDNMLGAGSVTVNPLGTLRYTSSTSTARTFSLFNGSMDVPSGVTLTMNGATVGGGFLRGTGTYTLNGNTAITGATTFTSTSMNVAGPASFTNFSNNGNLTVAAGQIAAMNYATNTSAGRMTINGTANVSDFVSNGLLTIPAGGVMNNSVSPMVLGGGSTTFVGAVGNLGGKIDLAGQQLHVRGGLLVTNAGSFASGNGVRNGTTIADYGALVKGTGPYQSVITQNGGQYLPGNSPGTSQVGDFFINGGGNLIFQITDAGPSVTFPSAPGTAGNNPGWGLTQVFTSMNFTATPASPYTITMQTQLPPPAAPDTPGPMSSFDPNRAYQWLIFDLQPGAVFNGTFDPNAINFATAQFVNSTMGGTFSLARNGGQIFLTFTPVPEPVAILAVAFGVLAVSGRIRRSKRRLASRA